jgi:uncharacterized protein (TIGR03086 family)
MATDLLELYRRTSDWTLDKIAGVSDLQGSTPCDDWAVRDLLNHMLETQNYFSAAARGEDASPPGQTPPQLLGDDPKADFEQARDEVIAAFSQEGVADKTGPLLGIAFADALLHGWDVAQATGQDARMPDELPGPALEAIHGRFTEEQRKGVFKPEISVGDDASAQDRLLAYTGRAPA